MRILAPALALLVSAAGSVAAWLGWLTGAVAVGTLVGLASHATSRWWAVRH